MVILAVPKLERRVRLPSLAPDLHKYPFILIRKVGGYFIMPTIRELYNFYIPMYRDERSPRTQQNYQYNMEKYILRYIGEKDISAVKLSEIQILLNQMKGMAETPIRSVYGDLKLMLRHAYIDEYICRDFATLLHSPQHSRGGFRRALTPLERGAVIEVAQTDQKYTGFLFMMLCGCRPSEAYAITKDDIDFEAETVHIRGTKTKASDRVVPCPTILLNIAEKSLYGFITASQTGLQVTKEAQVRIWHSFFIDCHKYLGGKIYRNKPVEPYPFGKDLVPYNLRHEYCTNLARNGVDIRITQKLMGHASPEMTLRVYTNLSDEDVCTDEVRKIVNNLQSCKVRKR
jgi:integrase